MTSTLEDFINSNIPKVESFKQNPEYSQAIEYASRHEEKLLARLNDEDKALFKKFLEVNGEVIRLTAEDNLAYGYKVGVVMTAEAFLTL